MQGSKIEQVVAAKVVQNRLIRQVSYLHVFCGMVLTALSFRGYRVYLCADDLFGSVVSFKHSLRSNAALNFQHWQQVFFSVVCAQNFVATFWKSRKNEGIFLKDERACVSKGFLSKKPLFQSNCTVLVCGRRGHVHRIHENAGGLANYLCDKPS